MPKGISPITLLPCPFCGELPVMEPWHGGGPKKRMVSCGNDDCGVEPCVTGENPVEAAINWNHRTPPYQPTILRFGVPTWCIILAGQKDKDGVLRIISECSDLAMLQHVARCFTGVSTGWRRSAVNRRIRELLTKQEGG